MRERTRLPLAEAKLWQAPQMWRIPVPLKRMVHRDPDARHLERRRPDILLLGASDLTLPDRAQEELGMLLTTSAGSGASLLRLLPQIFPYPLSHKKLPILAQDSLVPLLLDAVILRLPLDPPLQAPRLSMGRRPYPDKDRPDSLPASRMSPGRSPRRKSWRSFCLRLILQFQS